MYIIAILVSILVASLSVKVADSKDLSDKLSFAVALASLLLAIIAIIQAFISNSSLSQTLGNMAGTAERVENASREISTASAALMNAVSNIPEGLAQVVDRVEKTHLSVEEMMSAFRTSPADREKEQVLRPSTDAQTILKHSTVGVLISLYAANRSYLSKKPLVIRDIYKTNGTFGDGVLAAFRSIGLINFKVGTGNSIDIQDIGPFTSETFAALFREMQATEASKKAYEKLERRVEAIDEYFPS